MLSNFQIEQHYKQDFLDADYKVFNPIFDIRPNSSLFTASSQGKRFLSDFGDVFVVQIKIEKVPNADIEQFLILNGEKVEFKQDKDDTLSHEMNCTVTTPNFNGQSFFNTVIFDLESVQSAHEAIIENQDSVIERRQIVNPRVIKKDGVRYVKKIIENGSIVLRTYEKIRTKTPLLSEDGDFLLSEDYRRLLKE